MRHYSCDHCGKDLTASTDTRYVVRMEVFPAADPAALTAADLHDDHVESMAEMLDELEAAGDDTALDLPAADRKLEFDLCPSCHRRFVADPLGRESRKPSFSPN